jgi:hypothetical protein
MSQIFLLGFSRIEFSWEIFVKVSNIKFRENPASGSHTVTGGHIDGRTDMTKLIGLFVTMQTSLRFVIRHETEPDKGTFHVYNLFR